jgi:carbon storage regulator
MLVLSRRIGERILIEPGIEIAVVDVRGGKVRIGIEAPASVRIRRNELASPPRSNLPGSIPAVSAVS